MGGLESATTEFKFRYVMNGNATGLMASKGAVQPDGLRLGETLLPFEAIVDTTTRDDRLVLAIDVSVPSFPAELAPKLQDLLLVLHVYKNSKLNLELKIDRYCSVLEAEKTRRQLKDEGQGHLYRTCRCPGCDCVVNLSGLPEAPYSYCRYCETVFGQGLNMTKTGNNYRECDQCGYHDRVQGYTEFYFYFLLVVWGIRHGRRHMCDSCAVTLSYKLLAANALFLLGIPNAVICAIRARAGREATLSSLAKANRAARNGNLPEADRQYNEVLLRFHDHPGVRYNQALSYLAARDIDQGLGYLEQSLTACPNYLPALRLVRQWTAQ